LLSHLTSSLFSLSLSLSLSLLPGCVAGFEFEFAVPKKEAPWFEEAEAGMGGEAEGADRPAGPPLRERRDKFLFVGYGSLCLSYLSLWEASSSHPVSSLLFSFSSLLSYDPRKTGVILFFPPAVVVASCLAATTSAGMEATERKEKRCEGIREKETKRQLPSVS
jgi:hypothetical protein